MKIPCENCIILPMCKDRVTNDKGYFTQINNLIRKCSLISDYVSDCRNDSLMQNYVTRKPTDLARIRDVIRYIRNYKPMC